jgi:hypothetical protein
MRLFFMFLFYSLLVSKALTQSSIPAEEASKYVGEFKVVKGYAYYSEIRDNKDTSDSVYKIIHLSGTDHSKTDFIIIIKTRKGSPVFTMLPNKRDLKSIGKGVEFDIVAEGKIFLFEGKPAIKIKENGIHILQRVG